MHQQAREAYPQGIHAAGRAIAEKITERAAHLPPPKVLRLGAALRRWRSGFLGYFDTRGAPDVGKEALDGIIELQRRKSRGVHNRQKPPGLHDPQTPIGHFHGHTLVGEAPPNQGRLL